MMFDTASTASVLFLPTIKKLKIEVINPAPGVEAASGKVITSITKPCEVEAFGTSFKNVFYVLDLPGSIDDKLDGILNWDLIKKNIVKIDATSCQVLCLDLLPMETVNWKRLPIDEGSKILSLRIKRPEGGSGNILVDTGSENQISLSPKNWEIWRGKHQKDPITLTANYMPGVGIVVSEVMWAKKLQLGPMDFNDVSIRKANLAEIANGGGEAFEASVSMEALKGLDFIVDGNNGYAYWAPKAGYKSNFIQNRAGVIFVPRNLESNDLIAHVVKGSPADEAGIKDGDVIQKANSRDFTQWRSGTVIGFDKIASESAGAKIYITLKRKEQKFETVITLRDIFGRSTASKP